MRKREHPASLVAERAVRYLVETGEPADSRLLVNELLATRAPDEASALRLLESAFEGDPRLRYTDGAWHVVRRAAAPRRKAASQPDPVEPEAPRALVFVEGDPPRGRHERFRLRRVAAMRLEGDDVIAACGGEIAEGRAGERLRRAVLDTVDGAIPILHDAPGALAAFEGWLGEPLVEPVSLRRLAQERLGLAARHGFADLVARLGMAWRPSDDPLEQADTLDACLRALLAPGEALDTLRSALHAPLEEPDWSRVEFDREFLRTIPPAPGTYRFYDREGKLLYVGKSRNLASRVASYFGAAGRRSPRIRALRERIVRIEYRVAGSDLEAMLREAEQIRRERPEVNVQREVRPRGGRAGRLGSILILEPAAPPHLLRAYLVREARLVGRVGLGPRGGGLRRIARLLEQHFFHGASGPAELPGPDLDVEVVARWLGAHRDRVVAFDPTDLHSADEVVARLRWFLERGSPFEPDGTPVLPR